MKTLIRMVFISLIGLHPVFGQIPWTLITPNPPRLGAYTAVSIGTRAYFWTTNNTVYSTFDGGNTFSVAQYETIGDVALGDGYNQGMAFTDSLTGFISDIAYGQFKTTDGGKSWRMVIDRANLEGSVLLFANKQIGWRFAGWGFYKTTDGGDSWQYNQVQKWQTNGSSSKACALDEKRLWLARSYIMNPNTDGAIYYSGDGGANWQVQSSAPRSTDSIEVRYSDIQMLSSGIGCAVGTQTNHQTSEEIGFISHTSDFGSTWTTSMYSKETPHSVLCAGDSTWLVFGNNGDSTYYRSSMDNGASWQRKSRISSQNYYDRFYAATYVPGYQCVLVIKGDGIYRSVDRGTTFTRLTSDQDMYVTDVTVERHHSGTGTPMLLAYGESATVLISEDDGATWQKKTMQLSQGSSISRLRAAEGVMYAMINQMQLYKSTDKGNSWVLVQTPNQGGQQGMEVLDANTLAVDGFPYMLSTTDGGNTWRRPPFPGSCWVNSIIMFDANKYVAAGSYYDTSGYRGMCYTTTDAGYNWRIVDLPEEIYQIQKAGVSTFYALGNRGFYKSIDGGGTWMTMRSSNDYSTYYTNLYFRDSLYGLLKESYYYLLTRDGGKTWSSAALTLPFGVGPDAMEQTSDGRFLVVGEGKLYVQNEPLADWKSAAGSMAANVQEARDELLTAYPNPFNPVTTILFTLPAKSYIRLTVYDNLGREVVVLANGVYASGRHAVQFDARDKSSGVYYYRLQGEGFASIKKILLLK
jgi:photosystem II stability/assembly factor-like uncharacterized protein